MDELPEMSYRYEIGQEVVLVGDPENKAHKIVSRFMSFAGEEIYVIEAEYNGAKFTSMLPSKSLEPVEEEDDLLQKAKDIADLRGGL
jgi:hypothetical protein